MSGKQGQDQLDQRDILHRVLARGICNDWLPNRADHRHQQVTCIDVGSFVDRIEIFTSDQIDIGEIYETILQILRCDERITFMYIFRAVVRAISHIANHTKRHHRPVGVDRNVGAVVVEDGASTIDDFLVALDLRHDLRLHLQWRQRNLEFFEF